MTWRTYDIVELFTQVLAELKMRKKIKAINH
jgi:hypothetical protein